MATHNGTSGGDTISVKDKVPTPGYTVTGAIPFGDFSGTSLIVNGQAGNDTITLSGLTAASGVTSVTVNGGNDNDTIYGSDSVELDDLLAANPTVQISIPTTASGTNLTSMGRMTIGSTVYTVWRMRNGTAVDLTAVTLSGSGYGTVFTGNLPAMTDTFFASPFSTGPATHILSGSFGSSTKASGTQVFDYDTDIGGDDILNGDSGDDTIYGNGGNDTITGGAGNDTQDGGDGSDTYNIQNGEASGDKFNDTGASGTDTIVNVGTVDLTFSSFNSDAGTGADTGIEVLNGSGKAIKGDAGNNTLNFSAIGSILNVSAINGFSGNDVITGNDDANVINGGDNNDTLTGNGGADTLDGGNQDDNLSGGLGDDTLIGGAGNDVQDGGEGSDTYQIKNGDASGDKFNDTGASGTDTIVNVGTVDLTFSSFNSDAGTGADTGIEVLNGSGKAIKGDAGNNTLNFSAIGSILNVSAINGLSGNDVITGNDDANVINGDDNNDTLTGNGGADTLDGGNQDDNLSGGLGNDTLIGGAGNDVQDGGEGSDTYNIQNGDASGDKFNDTGTGGSDVDKIVNVGTGDLTFSSFNSDVGAGADIGIEEFDGGGKAINGDAGNNTLNFSAIGSITGVTAINGFSGNDVITGNDDANVINGGDNNDSLTGNGGADTLDGGNQDDNLSGGLGNDTLIGGAGNDVQDGGDGSDTYNIQNGEASGDKFNDTGVSGTDTIVNVGTVDLTFSSFNSDAGTGADTGIEVLNGSGNAIKGDAGNNTLNFSAIGSILNVSAINGLSGNDVITGNADANVINGGDNNDTLTGNGGADTLDGGNQDDNLSGGLDNDTLIGGAGNDVQDGGEGSDTYQIKNGDASGDKFTDTGSASDTDTIVNVSGTALTFSSFNSDAGAGADTGIEVLNGNSQFINGDAGNNTLNFAAIGTITDVSAINGLSGNDTVWTAASHTGAVPTAYDGGANTDTINLVFTTTQLGAFSVVDIGTLNTYVTAPTGKSLARSGGTHNIASLQFSARNFESATANVLVDGQVWNITGYLGGINNVVVATPTQTTIIGTPNQDLIVGNALNNTINGLAEADLIFGLGGNDSIKGGAGADYLFGGEGDDTFLANQNEAEFDVLQGGSGSDTLQRTTDGGQGNLVLNGFSATNGIERINLDAGGSNRAIDGNATANVLNFSATTLLSGNVNGLGGNDTITATNSATRTYDGGDGNDILNGGMQADNLIGGADNDTILGNGGNDNITGGAGADNLDGGEGNDTFFANLTEAEFDTLQGGNGVDTLQRTTNGGQGNLVLNGFSAANGIEQINLDAGGSNRAIDGNANGNVLDFSATTLLSGNVFGLGGDDIITATDSATRTYDGGVDNDTLIGGTQNDILLGGLGVDIISGNGGNDRIVGGDGADTLTGGGGADVFRFANPIEGSDTITDFVVVDDTIEISTSGFAGVGGLGTLSASRFAYAGNETASTRIIYALGTGAVSYDADGSGIGAAVQFAQLNTGLALTNADFSIGF